MNAESMEMQFSAEAGVEVVTVTPAIAKEWLAMRVDQRSLNSRTVKTLMGAMLRHEWALNGESVKFNVLGHLIDGQHRLSACVESGRSFQTLVVRGLAKGVISTLDTNRKRTLADTLHIQGRAGSESTARCTQWVWALLEGAIPGRRLVQPMTIRQGLATLAAWPEIAEATALVLQPRAGTVLMGRPSISGAVAMLLRTYPDEVRHFVEGLVSGINLTSTTDPVLVLRRRLMGLQMAAGRSDPVLPLAVFCHAWLAFLENRPLTAVLYRSDAAFPKLRGGAGWIGGRRGSR